ncbi:MAG TPA: aminotransferase class I/II-fold pyridoxal phosphate-dependent enzyme [Polyangiaceae bacterium]|nr:aminotransferase class I/II-fold pyridoxal phosphate-dependent enzyme [Polyangiaceae bacterium]
MSRALRFLGPALEDLDANGRLRRPVVGRDPRLQGIDLASNDYLGFASEPLPSDVRGGAGASALVLGYHDAHLEAERALAAWIGAESVLLFSSGYAANVGVLSALGSAEDLIVSDALNHASIVDGCRLARAATRVTPHLDVASVERVLAAEGSRHRRRIVVVESYYSMDGDGPDLAALRAVCDQHDAILVVDEAHALGVFGPRGRGRCAEAGIEPDVRVGPLGKAFGLGGAFVAGSQLLRTWLWNAARSFVFSTALSPAVAAAVPARVAALAAADDRRARILEVSSALRAAVAEVSGDVRSFGPIVPWILGSDSAATVRASALQAAGVIAVAIRPPTVPRGTARIRLVGRASLTDSEVTRAVALIRAPLP